MKRYSGAEKAIIPIGIIAIMMMLLFNMAIFRNYQTNLLNLQEGHMLTTARAVANGLKNYYEELLSHFSMYFESGSSGIRLAEFCETQQGVSGIAIVCESGSVTAQYGSDYRQYYPEAIAGYQKLGHQKAALLPPVLTGERHYTQFMIREIKDGPERTRYVIAAVETEHIYEQIVKPIQIGENGYSMVKEFSGTILMHKARNQIGIDAVAGRKKQYQEYDLDLENLEAWIERQRIEAEGSGVISSYWWEDNKAPSRTKKVVAYTQVPIGEERWIVNCTLDYDEIKKPLEKTQMLVFLMTAGIVLAFGLLLFLVVNSMNRSRAMEQELKHLLEMNEAWEELHKREEQIRHNDKMKTLGTMTSMIAHEFNNFLTPIMLYGEMLLGDPAIESGNKECLQEIVAAAEKARELTGELSRYGRTDDGQRRNVTVQVTREIKRSLNIVSKTLPANITLQQQLESDTGYGMLASAGLVNQIVVNLCTNAVHAMQQSGGILTIKGTLMKEKGTVRYGITIEDTGHGMSEATLKQIFTPFYTTKESGSGTGLGLTVVQDLIHQVSGEINAISVEGQGSRFDILLPLFEVQEPQQPQIYKDNLKERTVYLLDDNDSVGRALEKSLRRECRKVRLNTHPERALAEIRQSMSEWDIIVTDYAMPLMNGLEFAGILRSLGYTGTILLISGCLDQDIRWYLDHDIIQSFLEKPVTVRAIQEVLES